MWLRIAQCYKRVLYFIPVLLVLASLELALAKIVHAAPLAQARLARLANLELALAKIVHVAPLAQATKNLVVMISNFFCPNF